MKKVILTICLLVVCSVMSGCNTPLGLISPTGPRGTEWGHVPTGNFDPNPGNIADFVDGFLGKAIDGNGIIYLRKAGTIDPDHIWGNGRNTISACKTSVAALESGKTSFNSHGMKVEINSYPDNWNNLTPSEKTRLAREVGLQIGKSIGFHLEIYHELGTWWGGGIDYQSSFSWEDFYSNALGAEFAMQGVKAQLSGNGGAGATLTRLTQRFINKNQYVSAGKCKKIVDSLEDIYWKSPNGVLTIQRSLLCRNVDVGSDGWIDNTPIPGFTHARDQLTRVPAPIMDYSNYKGFDIDVWVSSGSHYGRAKRILGVSRINIKDHPRLMQIVGKECEAKGNRVFY